MDKVCWAVRRHNEGDETKSDRSMYIVQSFFKHVASFQRQGRSSCMVRCEEFFTFEELSLCEGKFFDEWKRQRLILFRKGEKSLEDVSSYRPICLLDTMWKLLEEMIL